ncbi:MAG: hypothetical protein ABIJ86_02735 [Spirochaetota bacterium]
MNLWTACIYGPDFISLYMAHAMQTNRIDQHVLSLMDAGQRRYPRHPKSMMGCS